MEKFVKKNIIFALILVFLLFIIDIIFSNTLKKSLGFVDGEYTVWNDIYNGEINSEILIYGSSRAWTIFSPSILEEGLGRPTYNLGINGHNFWLQHLRHKMLLKNNPKPKYIIVSIDATTLEKREGLFNNQQFLPYMLFDLDMYNYTKSYTSFSKLDYFVPLLRYSGKITSLVEINNGLWQNYSSYNFKREKGYKGLQRTWTDDLYEARKIKKNYVAKIDDESKKLFIKFLEDCNEDDIEIIFVYAPEYIEGQDYVTNRDEIILLFKDLSEKYDISFLDYSNHEISKRKEFFYNTLHLNKTGSEIFTKELIKDLKNINNLHGICADC